MITFFLLILNLDKKKERKEKKNSFDLFYWRNTDDPIYIW